MKKSVKYLFVGISVIFLFILGIVLLFIVSSHFKKKKVKENQIEYSKLCDSTKIINEQPEICFSNFNQDEISTLKFEIKRDGTIFKDTIVKNKFSYTSDDKTYKTINIPFIEFLKTDTIIVTIKNNLKFYLSDFQHGANLHYGMFGPVGGYDCALNKNFNINGSYGNCLTKDISLIESERHNRIKVIGAMDKEIETISKKSKITKEMAEKIFTDNRTNKHLISQIFCGIHLEKTGIYYIFKEQNENKKDQFDIIEINAETGAYKRYSNYPFN